MPERRAPQPFNTLQLIALMISAIGLILGPCFGAGVAVVGTYVSIQSKSAVSDQKVDALAGEVRGFSSKLDALSDKLTAEQTGNTVLKTQQATMDKRIDEAMVRIGTLEQHATKQENQYSQLIGATGGKK